MVKRSLLLILVISIYSIKPHGGHGGGHHGGHQSGGHHGSPAHHGGHHGDHHGGHHGGHQDHQGHHRGYGNPRWGGFNAGLGLGYGIGWGPGLVAGIRYNYVLPQRYIQEYYGGYYPYWGYGLGYDEELVSLAQEDRWEDIIQKLTFKKEELEAKIQRLQQDSSFANRERIVRIKNKIAKIQVHLDGLIGALKY